MNHQPLRYSTSFQAPHTFFAINDNVIKCLSAFSNLEKGWDCGFGSAITEDVILNAIFIYLQLKDEAFEYECTPYSNNSIEISFCLKDDFINIRINSDKTIDYTHEKGIGWHFETLLDVEGASVIEIKNLLKEIKEKCFSLEPSILVNTNQKGKDLKSVLQYWEMEYPCLNTPVLTKTVAIYVPIYVNTIPVR